MGRTIRMALVYRAILKTYGETIANFEAQGRTSVTFSYEAFESAIFESEICYDRRTVKAKWNMAVAQGVLDEITPGVSANLDLPYLRFLARVDSSKPAHTPSCMKNAQDVHEKYTECTQGVE